MTALGDLLDGLAQHLADLGHGVWSTDAVYGPEQTGIVVGSMPPEPDRMIRLATPQPGLTSDARLAYDTPVVAIRVRGRTHQESRALAVAIYSALHGTGHLLLPGGIQVVNIIGQQGGPIDIGQDTNGRPEHTVNLAVEHVNPTQHRP